MSLLGFIKGWLGEGVAAVAQRLYLDDEVYHALNNLTLPTRNGTTQIDHVIVSVYGIFVVESKNIDGWIFGDEHAPTWTVVRPRKKYRIQNPLRQNHRHVKALAEFLNLPDAVFHSVVAFWGECEFKTPMPPQVMTRGYVRYIESFTRPLLAEEQIEPLVLALKTGALPKTWATRRAHLDSLQQRHGSTTRCARCGAPLVLRTARNGPQAGTRFYGCSAFPRCRHTVAVAADDPLA